MTVNKLLINCVYRAMELVVRRILTEFVSSGIIPILLHLQLTHMPKRTYQPSKRKRSRKHGFLKRARSQSAILQRRRRRGRAQVSPA